MYLIAIEHGFSLKFLTLIFILNTFNINAISIHKIMRKITHRAVELCKCMGGGGTNNGTNTLREIDCTILFKILKICCSNF